MRRISVLLGVALVGVVLASGLVTGRPSETGPPVASPAPPSVPAPLARPLEGAPSSLAWTTFHGANDRTGFTPATGPQNSLTRWYVLASGNPIRAGPLVNDSFVYVADALGNVFELNATTGGTVWRAAGPASPSTPALVGPELVLGGGDGTVEALLASNGSVRWTASVGAPVLGGLLSFPGELILETSAGLLVALDPSRGTTLWTVSLSGNGAGAPASDGSAIYATTTAGTLSAWSLAGAPLWNRSVGWKVGTGPIVTAGLVVVADLRGNLTALHAATGRVQWVWDSLPYAGAGPFEAPPASNGTALFCVSHNSGEFAVRLSNGSLLWNTTPPPPGYLGWPMTAAPVVTPGALYIINALMEWQGILPATGQTIWSAALGNAGVEFDPPAVVDGGLIFGDENGGVWWVGRAVSTVLFPVQGTVVTRGGAPIPGAFVESPFSTNQTDALGRYTLPMPNGTYPLTAGAVNYEKATVTVTVAGPTAVPPIVLHPPTLYAVVGVVLDADSGHGIPRASIQAAEGAYFASTATDPAGRFSLALPNGTALVTVGGLPGFANGTTVVTVAGASPPRIEVDLVPAALGAVPSLPFVAVLALPFFALVGAAVAVRVRVARGRRIEEGLPPQVLSPFGWFVVGRAILIGVQTVVLLVVLFTLGTFLPGAATYASGGPCGFHFSGCAPAACTWHDVGCTASVYGRGVEALIVNLFTGQWGMTSFGHLNATTTQFVAWWLPPSLELAAIALALSAGLAYVLGMLAGWRRDGAFDTGVRLGTVAALLLPTFVIVLTVLAVAYVPFLHQFGDSPYRLTPTPTYLFLHGTPDWIGPAGTTLPTGLPLVDGAVHGAWGFEAITLAKTLLQASIIAVVYVGIFLRYARHAVAEAAQEPHLTAARSRGVSERTLLWTHTGRRVWPIYVLLFAVTLPVYLGTQAVVEALFNDAGLGTLFLSQLTQQATLGFQIATSGGFTSGNVYQAILFLLIVTILAANLAADVLARYLDPRLQEGSR